MTNIELKELNILKKDIERLEAIVKTYSYFNRDEYKLKGLRVEKQRFKKLKLWVRPTVADEEFELNHDEIELVFECLLNKLNILREDFENYGK